jgi:hypothetical protein
MKRTDRRIEKPLFTKKVIAQHRSLSEVEASRHENKFPSASLRERDGYIKKYIYNGRSERF